MLDTVSEVSKVEGQVFPLLVWLWRRNERLTALPALGDSIPVAFSTPVNVSSWGHMLALELILRQPHH